MKRRFSAAEERLSLFYRGFAAQFNQHSGAKILKIPSRIHRSEYFFASNG